MQLLENYGEMNEGSLWAAEPAKLSSLQTCVLLSLLTVTSASSSWASILPPYSSDTLQGPSQELSSVLAVPSRAGQCGCSGHCVPGHPARYPAAHQGCQPSISPLLAANFHQTHGNFRFEISILCKMWLKKTRRVMTRGTGRQWDVINLSSVGRQAKQKHPEGQTLHTCAVALGWDELQPGILLPSKGQAVAQEKLSGEQANSCSHKIILLGFNWEILLTAASLFIVKLGFFVKVSLW